MSTNKESTPSFWEKAAQEAYESYRRKCINGTLVCEDLMDLEPWQAMTYTDKQAVIDSCKESYRAVVHQIAERTIARDD